MTICHRAGMLHLLVLTLLLTSPADQAAADETRVVATVEKKKKAEVAKIDLARDLANKLVRPGSMEFKSHRLKSARKIDYFLVYFGAHWCSNCKKFTPKLTEFYAKHRSDHLNFEVIFVSADKDEDAMLHYMNGYKMPWPAVKFDEREKIESLAQIAGRGYPCVALVDATAGKVIAHSYGKDGKGDYVGPMKALETLKGILDKKESKPVARAGE